MGDPMPTVMAKGQAGEYFDDLLSSSSARWEMLQRLRAIPDVQQVGLNGEDPLVDALLFGLQAKNPGLYNNLRDALSDWFRSTATKWNYFEISSGANFNVDDVVADGTWADLNKAREIVHVGIMRALEVSLRLPVGGSPNVIVPWFKAILWPPARGGVKLHWVCGKGDGFDVQVTWSSKQVDCFILTPPIRLPVPPLDQSLQGQINHAMAWHPTGMLHISAPVAVHAVKPNVPPATTLVHRRDGGLTT